jgi:hypothetical protein
MATLRMLPAEVQDDQKRAVFDLLGNGDLIEVRRVPARGLSPRKTVIRTVGAVIGGP